MAIGFVIRRKTAEDIQSKGFKNSKSTLCRSSHGLSITEKKSFSSNALASRYLLNNIDEFEKIEKNGNIFFDPIKNIDFDDLLYDMYQTEGPLAGYIIVSKVSEELGKKDRVNNRRLSKKCPKIETLALY